MTVAVDQTIVRKLFIQGNIETEMNIYSLNGISDCLACYTRLQFIVYPIEVHIDT